MYLRIAACRAVSAVRDAVPGCVSCGSVLVSWFGLSARLSRRSRFPPVHAGARPRSYSPAAVRGLGAAVSPLHEGGRGRVKSGVCRETTVSKAATFVARYNNHSAGVYLLLTAASKYFLPLLLYYITVSLPATRIFH